MDNISKLFSKLSLFTVLQTEITKNVLIDDSESWAKVLRSYLTTAHEKVPYFMYFADNFKENKTK